MKAVYMVPSIVLGVLGVLMIKEGYYAFGIVDLLLSALWALKALSK